MWQNARLKNRGLTLTEILVVVFIFSILSTILFTIFKGGLDSWRKSENILTMYEEGRTVLDMMSREIQAAYLFQNSTDQTQWTKFYGIDETGTRLKTNSAKDELFFVAPLASRTGEAIRMDLCEIGYWIDGKGTENNSDDVLMRHFESFTTLPVEYTFITPDPDTSTKIASSVTDLQFTYYYRSAPNTSPAATTTNWDSSSNNPAGRGENYDANGNAKNPDGLPDAVGVSITVRSRDGSQTRTFTTLIPVATAK
jgi:prepilin-type N-terminal cleavage/methylation domain-containing protein